jgi:F420-dependent oxidoreductase-like protein
MIGQRDRPAGADPAARFVLRHDETDAMKLGLHLNEYAWPGGHHELGTTLAGIAVAAEAAGFAQLSVTDHVWQTSAVGEEADPMLEAYTTLAFLAGRTSSIELIALASPATYREPGMLAKIVTTLDVLSGGRAWLGLGAGWNEEEAIGLGLPFAGTGERFARLEEVVKVCLQMFSADTSPFNGTYYRLSSTLNSPPPVSSPRPRLLIGGGGEHTTLRLVAQYADACNVYGGAEAGQKLIALRKHCEELGRDYAEIRKTAIVTFDVDHPVAAQLDRLRSLHELGFDVVNGSLPGVSDPAAIESFGAKVVSEVANW